MTDCRCLALTGPHLQVKKNAILILSSADPKFAVYGTSRLRHRDGRRTDDGPARNVGPKRFLAGSVLLGLGTFCWQLARSRSVLLVRALVWTGEVRVRPGSWRLGPGSGQ